MIFIKKYIPVILLTGIFLFYSGCSTERGFPAVSTIRNFDKVDRKVYRGAQPNEIGLEYLKQIEITTVINLRNDPWNEEKNICKSLGIKYYNLPMSGYYSPTLPEIKYILKKIDNSKGIIFIHCEFGCERTGVVVASYKIKNGESNKSALKDARIHGLSVFLPAFAHFITNLKQKDLIN